MLITGVLAAGTFLGGRLSLDLELAREAYRPIAERLGVSIEDAAAGVIRLVDEYTIDALKLVSVRRGYDPRDFTLVAFGGGGPMHAAALAGELGVKEVIVPPLPGTFSAWGMLMTEPRVDLTRTAVMALNSDSGPTIASRFAELEAEALGRLVDQGFDADRVRARRALDLRYAGQEHTVRLAIDADATPAAIVDAFHGGHRRQYTFALLDTPVEIVNYRVTSTVTLPRPAGIRQTAGHTSAPTAFAMRTLKVDGMAVDAAVYERANLPVGFAATGPLIVEEASATTLVLGGQRLSVDEHGNLRIVAR